MIKEFEWKLVISEGDFEHAFNRKPKSQEEFDDFAHYCKNGAEAQLDWSMIVNCAKEAM